MISIGNGIFLPGMFVRFAISFTSYIKTSFKPFWVSLYYIVVTLCLKVIKITFFEVRMHAHHWNSSSETAPTEI